MLPKAGQKANLPDQRYDKALALTALVKASSAKENVQTKDVVTGSPSDYVPQVGDVVEFEDNGTLCQGVIFKPCSQLGIAAKWKNDVRYGYDYQGFYLRAIKTARKIGYVDLKGETDSDAVIKIAKAYFATAKPFAPDPDKSYAENQAAWVKFHGLKVGDKVKVARKAKSNQDGWDWGWMDCMDDRVGETLTVDYDGKDRLRLSDGWNYPYFALEPVK